MNYISTARTPIHTAYIKCELCVDYTHSIHTVKAMLIKRNTLKVKILILIAEFSPIL